MPPSRAASRSVDPGQREPDRARTALTVVRVGDEHRPSRSSRTARARPGRCRPAPPRAARPAAAPTRSRPAAARDSAGRAATRPGGGTWSARRRSSVAPAVDRLGDRRRLELRQQHAPTPRSPACRADRRRARARGTAAGTAPACPPASTARPAVRACALASRLPCESGTPFGMPGGARRVDDQRRVVEPGPVELGPGARPGQRGSAGVVTGNAGAGPSRDGSSSTASAGRAAADQRRPARPAGRPALAGTTVEAGPQGTDVRHDQVDARRSRTAARGHPAPRPAAA